MKKWALFAAGVLFFLGCRAGFQPYDSDGMLRVDGARRFIIGSYHVPKSPHPFRDLAQMGFNLVHVGADSAQIRRARQAGLKVWVSLGGLDAKNKLAIQKTVNTFKSDPALLFWETVDEPAWTWKKTTPRVPPEPLIREYELVKSLDPTHLLYLNHAPTNLISTLKKYNPATDILACDIYPVIPHGIREQYALNPDGRQGDFLNCFVSQVGDYTRKMRNVAGQGRPVFMVLQGFAWEMLRKPGDRDSTKILFPTERQTRFMAYDAILNGANGVLFWGTAYTPSDSPFFAVLARVTRELASLEPALSARSIPLNKPPIYHEMGHSLDRGVVFLFKRTPEGTFLLSANEDPNPVHITWPGLKNFHKAVVLGENRTLSIEKEALTDRFLPFAVHVYRLK
jgi:hypothetical protein